MVVSLFESLHWDKDIIHLVPSQYRTTLLVVLRWISSTYSIFNYLLIHSPSVHENKNFCYTLRARSISSCILSYLAYYQLNYYYLYFITYFKIYLLILFIIISNVYVNYSLLKFFSFYNQFIFYILLIIIANYILQKMCVDFGQYCSGFACSSTVSVHSTSWA